MLAFLTPSDWYTFLQVMCIVASVAFGIASMVLIIVGGGLTTDACDQRRPHPFRPILLGVLLAAVCASLSAFTGICAWRFSHLAANPPRAEREV